MSWEVVVDIVRRRVESREVILEAMVGSEYIGRIIRDLDVARRKYIKRL